MQEGDATFIRICFPFHFEETIKTKGKYDLNRLYEKGIVLSINEITEREEHDETLLQTMRMELACHPLTPHRVMIFDVSEFKDKVELWFDFVKSNDSFGKNPAEKFIWLLRNIQAGSILFSKQLNKEYDNSGDEHLGMWHFKRYSRAFTIPNTNGKKIYIHTTLISAYGYLFEEPFLTDLDKTDFDFIWDKLNSKKNKPIRRFVRSPISNSLRHEVFKRDNYTCKECGRTNKDSIIHCDHILPVTQGGTDELSNLQTLCEECNLQKKNRAWESKGMKA